MYPSKVMRGTTIRAGRWTCLLAATLALAGCGGDHSVPATTGGTSSSSGGTTDFAALKTSLQTSGQLPVLDTSAPLAGVDADVNGVRDDLDKWIAAQSDPNTGKAALLQMAKALQGTLLVDATNPDATKAAALAVNRAVVCIWTTYSADDAPNKVHVLQQLTVNTMPRLVAYEAFNLAMNGSVTQDPAQGACDHAA